MKFLFILATLTALNISNVQAGNPDAPVIPVSTTSVQKWEPSEQDQIKVKLLSYQFLKAKDDGDFNVAFGLFSESTKSSIDFKQWKRNQVIFNATAGAVIDRLFTRISWYENAPDEALPGIIAIVDYSGVFTNVEIQCGNLTWHMKADGNFELIREQENFIDKASQAKLSDSEITEIKVKFGCKRQ